MDQTDGTDAFLRISAIRPIGVIRVPKSKEMNT